MTDYHSNNGTETVDLVQQYRYLSILLDEHLKYHICVEIFVKSGGRVLTSLISKYTVYTYMYIPIYLILSCTSVKRAAIITL